MVHLRKQTELIKHDIIETSKNEIKEYVKNQYGDMLNLISGKLISPLISLFMTIKCSIENCDHKQCNNFKLSNFDSNDDIIKEFFYTKNDINNLHYYGQFNILEWFTGTCYDIENAFIRETFELNINNYNEKIIRFELHMKRINPYTIRYNLANCEVENRFSDNLANTFNGALGILIIYYYGDTENLKNHCTIYKEYWIET